MRRRVTLRRRAETDLVDIYEFIARDSPQAAFDFTLRIRTQCEELQDFPERGTRRDELAPGIRVLGFERRVVIAYRVLVDRVQIVRILYGGRDFENILRKDGRKTNAKRPPR